MSKIRINELARELEVKPNRILELLPEFGVEEKKTHSSSIDEDVAVAIKKKLGIDDADSARVERNDNGAVAVADEPEEPIKSDKPELLIKDRSSSVALAEAVEPATEESVAALPEPERHAPTASRPSPLRPPLAAGPLRPPTVGQQSAPPSGAQAHRRTARILRPLRLEHRRPSAGRTAAACSSWRTQASSGCLLDRLRERLGPVGMCRFSVRNQAKSYRHPAQAQSCRTGPPRPLCRELPRPAPTPGAPRPPVNRAPLQGTSASAGPAAVRACRTAAPPQRPSIAGQPAARPVVPPNPELLARIQQSRPGPPPAPGQPRPGSHRAQARPLPGSRSFAARFVPAKQARAAA